MADEYLRDSSRPSYLKILKKKRKKKPPVGFQEVPMDLDAINASFDATTKKEKE